MMLDVYQKAEKRDVSSRESGQTMDDLLKTMRGKSEAFSIMKRKRELIESGHLHHLADPFSREHQAAERVFRLFKEGKIPYEKAREITEQAYYLDKKKKQYLKQFDTKKVIETQESPSLYEEHMKKQLDLHPSERRTIRTLKDFY